MKKSIFILFIISLVLKGVVHNGGTIVQIAKQQEGKPYILGEPHNEDFGFGGGGIMNYSFYGFDCSGLVSYAAGLRRHFTVSELGTYMNSVSWSNLQPGDILKSSGHAMIFKRYSNTPNYIWYISASSGEGEVHEGHQDTTILKFTFSPYRFNTEAVAPEITITGVVDGMTYTDPVTLKFTATDNLETPSTYAYGQWKGPRFPQGSPQTYGNPGQYLVQFLAADWAWNLKDTSVTFWIDGPPQVFSTYPPNNAQGIAIDISHITIVFSRSMDHTSTENAISAPFSYTTSWVDEKTVNLTLLDTLDYLTEYTVTISDAAMDTSGIQLDENGDGGYNREIVIREA